MKINQVLVESAGATVAFAFGRFNPAHQGHIEVWRAVEDAGANWFIGTNATTIGPNDPLTFQQKSAWMEEIYPPITGHIVAEQSVLTLAAYIFKKVRKNENATIAYITDATDWAWSGKLLNQYNGVEGAHGYYKFAQIVHVPSPRVSSATALRDAARADDKVAFYHASGTDPKSKVAGLTYFDTVKQACEKYPLPVKKAKNVKEEQIDEIDRRGFLKGMGAAAVAGAAGGAKADRFWQQDELTKQWKGQMTSETFKGAVIHWDEEQKSASLALTEPTNFSLNNIKDKRLYFPKITSNNFTIKIGDSNPFNGAGAPYTFPLRQLGDYKGNGLALFQGQQFSKVRDEFINADKVLLRVEVDGVPTTMTFHDNPNAVQQRQTQKAGQDKQTQKQRELDADNAKIKANLRQQVIDEVIDQKGPIIPGIACAIVSEGTQFEFLWRDLLKYFTQFMPGIPEHYQTIKQMSKNKDEILGIPKSKWAQTMPKYYKELKDYRDKIESYGVKESVNQGVAEDNLKEFAPGNGGGESGRWYTDDQLTDLVGDGWWNDLDISGDVSKQEMIQEAQAWLDDQGYSVQVLNCKVNDDDMEWYIEGSFHNPGFAKKGIAEEEQKTVAKTWDQMTAQEKSSGVKGRTVWNEKTKKYYTVFDVPTTIKEDEEAGEVKKTGQLIPFPAGTTKVHVSDVYDWYKLGQVISDLDDANPNTFGQGAPQSIIAFGSEEEESKLLPLLKRLGLRIDDIDPEGTDLDEAYHAGELYEYLKKVHGKWALVSKSNPKKVLQYYRGGDDKPSDEWVNKVERRVHSFESKKK